MYKYAIFYGINTPQCLFHVIYTKKHQFQRMALFKKQTSAVNRFHAFMEELATLMKIL